MIRRDKLFHDMTLDYHQPTQPKPGNYVFIYFRCGQDEAVKAVYSRAITLVHLRVVTLFCHFKFLL